MLSKSFCLFSDKLIIFSVFIPNIDILVWDTTNKSNDSSNLYAQSCNKSEIISIWNFIFGT